MGGAGVGVVVVVVVGCCWLLLVVVGCCWLLLVVVVVCRRLLKSILTNDHNDSFLWFARGCEGFGPISFNEIKKRFHMRHD